MHYCRRRSAAGQVSGPPGGSGGRAEGSSLRCEQGWALRTFSDVCPGLRDQLLQSLRSGLGTQGASAGGARSEGPGSCHTTSLRGIH